LAAGNVRADGLVDVYRNAPLFRSLHDPAQFENRCGACEFHALCGGSRARAFAATRNPLASDPLCVHEPRAAIQPPVTLGV
jgi:radical SAM protein with 4Fe4S-binding SPASM domain